MGTIEELGPPLYLVSASERRLLGRAGCQLVISDSQLGPKVTAVLRDGSASQHCNVQPLRPVDTLKVLQSFLPTHWFSSPVGTAIDREAVTDEWLGWLWTYILEEKAIALFEGVFPLLPILPPQVTFDYLCRIMSYYVILCHTMSCYVMSCRTCIMSYNIILCRIISYYVRYII